MIQNKKHQRALTRLRVSSHKLNVELGRHSRPPVPRTERICNFCDVNEIDDEIHFMIKCKFHDEARSSLLNEIINYQYISDNLSPETLFQCIMTSKNEKVLSAIAKFIYVGFQKRDNCPG